jgi:hypothetical protein
MIEQERAKVRQAITRREGVRLGGLKIKNLIDEAARKAAARRHCPITRAEAQAMIAEVKGARLLRGFRGRPAADLEALEDTLVRVSYLAMHLEGHLAELDINPLMVLPSGQGVKAVDALVVFRGT